MAAGVTSQAWFTYEWARDRGARGPAFNSGGNCHFGGFWCTLTITLSSVKIPM